MQHSASFPGFQSQSPSNTNQTKLQHFDDRSSGSPFLPPSQKLQHFNDPLLSSSPQRFHSLQSSSPQQFSEFRPPSQINMCWPRGQQPSRSSPNYSGFSQGSEQSPFRQPFGYGFPRSSSPRLQHFANQSPMNSSPDRFVTGPSQSPRLQHPNPSPSLPYSGSSPKGTSPKTMEPNQQQKQKQISPQQALYRHLQGAEGNQQQIELGGQGRLQHLVSSNTGDIDQGKPSLPGPGDGNFPYNPFQSGSRPPMAMNRNSPQAGYNSQQFQNPQYAAFNGGVPGGVDQDMFGPGNQHNMAATPQQPGYPYTNLQMSDPQELMQVKTSAILLQMQRIQQQIQQMREMGQTSQMQQLQFQFQRLYQIYAMQQQRRVQPNFQPQNFDQMRFIQQRRQQEKANRIAVEAMAKAALHNSDGMAMMPGFPPMSSGQRMMGNPSAVNTGMMDLSRHPMPAEPINLGPSIVQKPAPVRSSQTSRPPATVLAKPAPIRNRKDSSDAEPSPPNSPSYFEEDHSHVSSITRRSLRERKKKTYKDDFDYNLSEEEGEKEPTEGGVQAAFPVDGTGQGYIPVGPEVEETTTVEKILAMRTKQDEELGNYEEFMVKFKNYSYLHCEWATAEKLARGDKRIHMKIKRYKAKQQNSMAFFSELDEEPFNPDYVEVDRVLDMSTGVDQNSGEPITHYLVKWSSQPYEESTWEIEADVDEAKIKQFQRLKELPPMQLRQFRPRPYPHEWCKMDTTHVYNNNNTLRDYQLEGVNWLTFCWCNRQNSILADEMGLGKTIQSISFLIEMQRYGVRGPFLVIAPLSTISNWQREFETWSDINAVVYHGSSSSRHLIQEYEFYFRDERGQPIPGLFKFEALITTYEIIIADNMQLSAVPWRCVVIDEAHRLKNRNCKLLEGLNNLSMEHRILLTGTPLQNNVDELFSLLNFLEPAQFPSQVAFLMEFGDLKTEAQVDKLKQLLKPMMLRRLKEDVEKNIAPKEETIIEVELTTIQKKLYRAILERNFAFLSKGVSSSANVPNLMNTMMELRKCCNHPFLINGAEDKVLSEHNLSLVEKTAQHASIMIEASGKLVLIHKLLPKLKSSGHKVLVFSQMVRCLDILEDYLVHMRYPYERIDGRVRGNLRQAAIDRFSKPDSDRFVFLLCTRAGGLGINLTAADTVIIFDSDWNPQNDIQAQARCHRIGQSRSVKVYRLITRNSYEREMFDRASMKLGLDKAVLQSMNTKENASNNQSLSKREIEDLLRKGAYGAIMEEENDDSSKFCEEDIDQILERRTQIIQIESQGKGSTFAKASFVSSKGEEEIDIDDPDFWQKWAKKAELDVDMMNKDNRIIDAPRQRKQTKRYGNEDGEFELSDLDLEEDEEAPLPRRSSWTRVECFRVEKNLLIYGWGQWKDVIASGRFKTKVSERDVEAISRTILVYCLHHYKGDEKVKGFIRDLIKASATRERLPSEERDATYTPLPLTGKTKTRNKKGKTSNKNKSAIALFEVSSEWRTCDPETLILDEGYKKHLQHHCNKILLRVKLLFFLRHEVIGKLGPKIKEGCSASDVDIIIYPPEGDPPATWWDEECDKSLLIGVYKYGYEHYKTMRADPSLCFLSKVGLPNNMNDSIGGEATDPDDRYDDEPNDDPDYQQPASMSQKDEDMDDEDDKDTVSAVSSPGTPRKMDKSYEAVGGEARGNASLRWPTPSDLNTRLRRIIAGYQRVVKKQELKKAAAEKERERKERFEEAVRQKELKKAEMAQKWSKREEVDFYRTVSTFGVEYNKEDGTYDWSRFRRLARLDKKNDERLTAYYIDFMAMCRRVCGQATEDDAGRGTSVEAISEERASRSLYRIQLLSKIREEVLPHEKLDERLQLAQPSPSFPDWWQCGKHDKDLLIGVTKHGISRTDFNLLSDSELSFMEVISKMPSNPGTTPMNKVLGDEKMSSPAGSIKTESSVPFDGFSPLNNDHEDGQREEVIKSFSQQLPTGEKVPEVGGSGSPSQAEQMRTTPPSTSMASASTSVKTEEQTPMAELYRSGSPGADFVPPVQEQSIIKEENILSAAVGAADPKAEDMEDTSRHSTPVPSHLNPGACQDEDSQLSFNQESESSQTTSIFSVRWPKDKVVIQRLDQLCDCVLKGEWPIVSKVADALLQNQLAANSPMSAGYPGLGDVDMASLPPGFAVGEDGLPEDPSKAFKLKRLDGLKLTFKKNRRKRKKDPEMAEGLSEDGGPVHKEPGHRKMPARVDGEWNEAMMNMEAPGHDFRWDPSMDVKPPKKKRASKKEKGEKPEKPPSGKKRGRKPKTDKLGSAGRLADTGGAAVPPDGAALDWTGFSLPNTVEGGMNQVSVIEEVNAGHTRAPLSKSPHESGTKPAFPAFADEFKNSSLEGDSISTNGQEETVAVIDRNTGRKLVGNAAPTLSNLVDWLQQNTSYDVAEESTAFVRSKGILPASLLNRLSHGAKKSNPTTPTAAGAQTSHHLYGSYNEMNYGATVSKSQFDSSSLPSSTSLTSTAPSSTHSEPTRSSFPFDSSQFGNFQHSMPFGPFGHMPYYASYGMGMAANSQGSTSFGENAASKQSQSPVSPSPTSSHVMFNNSYSSLFAGQQTGNGPQGYPPGMASNAFSYPLLNNGNLAASPLSSKGDLLPDSASRGSSSIGSDISSQSSPDNDC
ncbi:hypothetical protein ACROYT_G013284 [Oculina patagonica]